MSTKKLPEAARAFDAAWEETGMPAAGAVAAGKVLGCSAADAMNAMINFGHVEAVVLLLRDTGRDDAGLAIRRAKS